MCRIYFSAVSVVFVANFLGICTPISEIYTKYEEYVIEHEISATQAKNTALQMDVASLVTPFGCDECTKEELAYCVGTGLINDHCCCDKKYKETLPFIPHTCYLGPTLCKTIVRSCEMYHQIKRCCCEKHALMHWKTKSEGSAIAPNVLLVNFLVLILTKYFLMLSR